MQRFILKSKIHRAVVTDANLNYEGSLTLDPVLMEQANLAPYERVFIYNITNGHRFDTYVIEGRRSSGEVCVNGAAARLAQKGDIVIVTSFVILDENEVGSFRPVLVFVDENNRPKEG